MIEENPDFVFPLRGWMSLLRGKTPPLGRVLLPLSANPLVKVSELKRVFP